MSESALVAAWEMGFDDECHRAGDATENQYAYSTCTVFGDPDLDLAVAQGEWAANEFLFSGKVLTNPYL